MVPPFGLSFPSQVIGNFAFRFLRKVKGAGSLSFLVILEKRFALPGIPRSKTLSFVAIGPTPVKLPSLFISQQGRRRSGIVKDSRPLLVKGMSLALFSKRIQTIILRERERFVEEVLHIQGLMPLLMKQRNGQKWTGEDLRQIYEGLKRLITIRFMLVVFFLPGTFLWLPLLAWCLDRRKESRPNESNESSSLGSP